jgi:hypothetical protein
MMSLPVKHLLLRGAGLAELAINKDENKTRFATSNGPAQCSTELQRMQLGRIWRLWVPCCQAGFGVALTSLPRAVSARNMPSKTHPVACVDSIQMRGRSGIEQSGIQHHAILCDAPNKVFKSSVAMFNKIPVAGGIRDS